uniref:Uncharacterized protein n=1 Tax=Anguilla anguilla TaxID=7936 RepID=A0A0E9T947_ANGAN
MDGWMNEGMGAHRDVFVGYSHRPLLTQLREQTIFCAQFVCCAP